MFFQKNTNKKDDLSKVAALLIHAARIDENYSKIEEKIIKKALLEIGANYEEVKVIIANGKKLEEDSNQILDFTKEVKNMENENKIKVQDDIQGIHQHLHVKNRSSVLPADEPPHKTVIQQNGRGAPNPDIEIGAS